MKRFSCPPGCENRHPGDETRPNCHMVCPHGYTEWNEQHQKELTERWEQNYPVQQIFGLHDEKVFRNKKRRRK